MTNLIKSNLKISDLEENCIYVLHCRRMKSTFVSRSISKNSTPVFVGGEVFMSTHTANAYIEEGQVVIFDAQRDGVNPKPFHRWQEEFGYEFIIFKLPVKLSDVKPFIVSSYWIPYGILDLARFWIHKKTGVWIGIDKEHKKRVCSENCMLIEEYAGIFDGDPEKMKPSDVLSLHVNNNYERIK